MSCMRVLLALIFPPFAVVDKGCGSFLIVFLLTCCGWVPGVIGAIVILNSEDKNLGRATRAYDNGYRRGYRDGNNSGGNGWQRW